MTLNCWNSFKESLMNEMRKIEVSKGMYILYNDVFFVKSCDRNIVWTSSRADAYVFNSIIEAEDCIEKINKFLRNCT